jgi:hypothetical protein
MTDLPRLIADLVRVGVRFIVVGGMAGIAHGAGRVTFDIDCVDSRDPETIARLADFMARFQPTLRGAQVCRRPSEGLRSDRGTRGPS